MNSLVPVLQMHGESPELAGQVRGKNTLGTKLRRIRAVKHPARLSILCVCRGVKSSRGTALSECKVRRQETKGHILHRGTLCVLSVTFRIDPKSRIEKL